MEHASNPTERASSPILRSLHAIEQASSPILRPLNAMGKRFEANPSRTVSNACTL